MTKKGINEMDYPSSEEIKLIEEMIPQVKSFEDLYAIEDHVGFSEGLFPDLSFEEIYELLRAVKSPYAGIYKLLYTKWEEIEEEENQKWGD